MAIRKALVWTLIAGAAAYAQNRRGAPPPGEPGFRILGAQPGRPGPIVKGSPYSADVSTEITQNLGDGNKIHQISSEHVYRDSEGRTRRETTLTALSAAAQIVFIDDPVAGVSYALDLAARTAAKLPFRPPPPAGRPRLMKERPATNDLSTKTESLGRQTISGVPADGTRTTRTISAGQIGNLLPIQIVSERWYSPDLQTVVLERRSDPRFGETIFQLTNIIRSEPSAALFAPPADFQAAQPAPRMRRGTGPRPELSTSR